jgi:hypothetical protein
MLNNCGFAAKINIEVRAGLAVGCSIHPNATRLTQNYFKTRRATG